MTAVTPTDRPKSVRNRCVIKVFGGVFFYVGTLLFGFFSVGEGDFVVGLSQIYSVFSYQNRTIFLYFKVSQCWWIKGPEDTCSIVLRLTSVAFSNSVKFDMFFTTICFSSSFLINRLSINYNVLRKFIRSMIIDEEVSIQKYAHMVHIVYIFYQIWWLCIHLSSDLKH